MRILIDEKIKGVKTQEVLAVDMNQQPSRDLAAVHAAMDRSGQFHQTGYLRAGLSVRPAPGGGSELYPPFDRLRSPNARKGFLDMLQQFMGTFR